MISANDAINRSDYLSELVDPAPDRHTVLSLHRFVGGVGASGAITEKPELSVQFFNMQMVDTPQEERTQYYMNASDAGKVILFGRSPRVYSFSGFLYDSDLAEGQGLSESESASAEDVAYNGRFLSRWNNLYENKLRLTKCLKNRTIVRIRWRDSEVYGYMLGNVRSLSANTPSMVSISFTFGVVIEAPGAEPPIVDTTQGPVPATMTKEGWQLVQARSPQFRRAMESSEMLVEMGDRKMMPR